MGLATGGALCLTVSLVGISEITEKVGPFILFYQPPGVMIINLLYHLVVSCKNYRKDGVFWNDQNFVKNGVLKKRNVLGFVVFSCFTFLNQNFNNLTVWTSGLAKINPGVVTVIFSATPICQALIDFCYFGERLKYNHWIGMLMMVTCSVLLAVQPIIMKAMYPENKELVVEEDEALPAWIPVLIGVIAPICFTATNIVTRWISQKKYGIGFDGSTVIVSSQFAVYGII